jgi:hypothetical protein
MVYDDLGLSGLPPTQALYRSKTLDTPITKEARGKTRQAPLKGQMTSAGDVVELIAEVWK